MIVIACDACKKTKDVSAPSEEQGWREFWSGRLKQIACGPDCVRVMGRALIERFGASKLGEVCLVPTDEGVLMPALGIIGGMGIYALDLDRYEVPYGVLPAMRWPEGRGIEIRSLIQIPEIRDVPFILGALCPPPGSPSAYWAEVHHAVARLDRPVVGQMVEVVLDLALKPETFPALHPFHGLWIGRLFAQVGDWVGSEAYRDRNGETRLRQFFERAVPSVQSNSGPWIWRLQALIWLRVAASELFSGELPDDERLAVPQLFAPWPLKPSGA